MEVCSKTAQYGTAPFSTAAPAQLAVSNKKQLLSFSAQLYEDALIAQCL